MSPKPGKPFVATLIAALDRGKTSDLTLLCDKHYFAVHQSVISPLSKVLAAQCNSKFVEGTTGTIKITDTNPKVVACMIVFLYAEAKVVDANKLDLNMVSKSPMACETSKGTDDTSPIELHVDLYALGDIYDISTLREAAAIKFEALVRANWPPPCYHDILARVFDNTPPNDKDLRLRAINPIAENLGGLLLDQEWTDMLDERGDVAVCIMRQAQVIRIAEVRQLKDRMNSNEAESMKHINTLLKSIEMLRRTQHRGRERSSR